MKQLDKAFPAIEDDEQSGTPDPSVGTSEPPSKRVSTKKPRQPKRKSNPKSKGSEDEQIGDHDPTEDISTSVKAKRKRKASTPGNKSVVEGDEHEDDESSKKGKKTKGKQVAKTVQDAQTESQEGQSLYLNKPRFY